MSYENNQYEEINLSKKFSNVLDFIEKHLALIVILPTLFGALMQIKALASINFAYIRFFSSSQLIPDGALALTIILSFAFTAYFYSKILGLERNSLKSNAKSYVDKFTGSLLTFTLSNSVRVIFLCIMLTLPLYYISDFFIKSAPILYLGFLAASLAIILHQFSRNIFICALMEEKTPNYKSENLFFIPINLTIFFTLVTSIFIFYSAFSLISQNLPTDLENTTKLQNKLKSEYKDLEQSQIIYFNDNYTFIEVKRKNNPEPTIAIYKTEKAFFE